MRLRQPLPPPLPKPFDAPPAPDGVRPSAETIELVRSQVQALLSSCPSYHAIGPAQRRRIKDDMVRVAAHAAELARLDWFLSARLGQRPLVIEREHTSAPVAGNQAQAQGRPGLARAQAAADEFRPVTANQIARVTRETLRAIAFPTFVRDLIQGTFDAIIQSTIHQMEAFGKLLANVGKTVDQFMADNITDNQARDWLAQSYPGHLKVTRSGEGARMAPQAGADERPLPDFRSDLNLPDRFDSLDEDSIEETLVPAARRKLAQTRLQMLSSMVLMGMQRIVVKHGKIRATMAFHIDTTDRAHTEEATDFDFSSKVSGSASYLMFSASASLSVTYVRSTKAESDAELNVEADLTGEVEISFKTDYFPLERFADSGAIERIRANTPVPEANAPLPVNAAA